ncbi:MAG: hypothetical protein IJI44_06600 [Erysipelotrichaceae bacterium]|nr:hypothetical protein [Erysipelotrichaceae bacterium]
MENEKKYLPEKVETYEALRRVFEEFKIDSEKTRFYIGDDYTDPKAFVIYQDDFGDFVVYKMKADGSRALRYKGKDERHAVSEYYQKFLEEVRKRPAFARKLLRPSTIRTGKRRKTKMDPDTKWFLGMLFGAIGLLILSMFGLFPIWAAVILFLLVNPGIFLWSWIADKSGRSTVFPPKAFSIVALVLVLLFGSGSMVYKRYIHKHDGYYVTPYGAYYAQGNDVYYYNNDDWYYYGTYDHFHSSYDDYTYYDDYYYNEDYDDFTYSDYYDDWTSSGWDSDSDYDSGWDSDSDSWDSWDSGGSDWDSDW